MFNIPKVLFLALCFAASAANASPNSGVFYAENGSKIVISDAEDSMFKFTLLLGAEGNALECIEGVVDCLSLDGMAKFDRYYYQYFAPFDPDSSILFDMRGDDVKIIGTNGNLGTGTANHNLASFAVGTYVRKESDLAQAAFADDLIVFHSPSDNINCLLATGENAEVRCDMNQLTPSFTTRPADCDLEWGDSFVITLNGTKGTLSCHGDTTITPEARVLNYGQKIQSGGFVCTSEKSGMTCVNPAGHGFSIKKAEQKLF